MTAEHREGDERDPPEASVLGSLPPGRPGRRSPRRAAPRARGAPGEPRRERATEEAATGPEAERGGVEDLAWAGIAVAAEAATLGVRLANRVLEAGAAWRRRPR